MEKFLNTYNTLNANNLQLLADIYAEDIRFNETDKVFYHRDYFDLGAMLYEQLSLLGRIIIAVKRRLGT